MKSIVRLLVIMMMTMPFIGMAQTAKTAPWPEMKKFHTLMAATFHPSEEGNFAPLKAKADSLFMAAYAWQASSIPSDYKPEETRNTLQQLVNQCKMILGAVEAKADDMKLKVLIADAHDIFHKVAEECKKTDH